MSKTPCEQRGYKVGDRFRVLEGSGTFREGAIVSLFRDDGSSCPCFKLEEGQMYRLYECADGALGAYTLLKYVTKLDSTYTGHGFKPGDRVEYVNQHGLLSHALYGKRGTVVDDVRNAIARPHVGGITATNVNVRWDSGSTHHSGINGVYPRNIRHVQEIEVTKPTGQQYRATRPSVDITVGRIYRVNDEGVFLDDAGDQRNLQSHIGSNSYLVPVEPLPRPVPAQQEPESTPPNVTTQDQARYLLRIVSCRNTTINGSFVERINRSNGKAGTVTGSIRKDNRAEALRLTFEEVRDFLRDTAEKSTVYEVVLDYIKTGYEKPKSEPARVFGSGGWEVGDVLRCTQSAREGLLVGELYRVIEVSGGDEVIEPVGGGNLPANLAASGHSAFSEGCKFEKVTG